MERVKKLLFVVASSLLFFCFPAFADEVEAADLPIEEVSHDVELINDSTKEASDISINNLAEIQGGMVKAPSINPDGNFEVLGYTPIYADNELYGRISFIVQGNGVISYNIINLNGDPFTYEANESNNYIGNSNTMPFTFVSYTYNNKTVTVNQVINSSVIDSSNTDNLRITTFLSFVGTVFTWLLATIGTLITFILVNPFLAVSLLLFMAGTVISFYIRIKNS